MPNYIKLFSFPELYSFNTFLDCQKISKWILAQNVKLVIAITEVIYSVCCIYTTEKHYVIDPCGPIHRILIVFGVLSVCVCPCATYWRSGIMRDIMKQWNQGVLALSPLLHIADWLPMDRRPPLVLPCQGYVCVHAYECVSRLCCFQDMTL